MVKEIDRIPFAGKIYDEAQRMIRLVEDIISLSHLDEGAKDMQYEDIDLYELAKGSSTEPRARGKDSLCYIRGFWCAYYAFWYSTASI